MSAMGLGPCTQVQAYLASQGGSLLDVTTVQLGVRVQ